MEQQAKTIMEVTMHFWQSIVQDEKLDQLIAQVYEAEGQLTMLKTSMWEMSLMV